LNLKKGFAIQIIDDFRRYYLQLFLNLRMNYWQELIVGDMRVQLVADSEQPMEQNNHRQMTAMEMVHIFLRPEAHFVACMSTMEVWSV
jgi:hypothetical protein